jgi:hypothetical protein
MRYLTRYSRVAFAQSENMRRRVIFFLLNLGMLFVQKKLAWCPTFAKLLRDLPLQKQTERNGAAEMLR